MEAVTFAPVDPRHPDAQVALLRYVTELSSRIEHFVLDERTVRDVDDFMAPGGVFLLGRSGDAVVGCGAVRALSPEIGEIKRMWVAPDFRGGGMGSRLLAALEDAARSLGYRVIRLDTNGVLVEAVRMYEAHGYHRIARYHDDPDPTHFFEKSLEEAGDRPMC
jgi:GNAT superfamily N-acetyltransferase